MLSKDRKKPHRVKWAEAERDLMIRGFFVPTNRINRGYMDPRIINIKEPDKTKPLAIPG